MDDLDLLNNDYVLAKCNGNMWIQYKNEYKEILFKKLKIKEIPEDHVEDIDGFLRIKKEKYDLGNSGFYEDFRIGIYKNKLKETGTGKIHFMYTPVRKEIFIMQYFEKYFMLHGLMLMIEEE